MKNLICSFLVILLMSPALAQVEMKKTKNTLMGKSKNLADVGTELFLDNFYVNLNLYKYGEDQGGGGAVVGIRTRLSDIDEDLAKGMVNEAYAYFVDKWKERGVTVVSMPKEKIEASKKYAKGVAKGNSKITNGGVWNNQEKKNHNMKAWPDGVNIASTGSGPMAVEGSYTVMMMEIFKEDPGYTSFTTNVDFMTFKTNKIGSTASVTPKPQLVTSSAMTAGKWVKAKMGGYIGTNEAEGIEDFYTDVNQDGFDFLGTSSNDWNYLTDKEKYRSNVMEMILKSIDDMFTDWDEVVAKENG